MSRSKFEWVIYIPFIVGVLICYGEYLVVKYYSTQDTVALDAYHVAAHETCKRACDNIELQMCQEWMAAPKGNLCPEVCDTFLEEEKRYGGSASTVFSCVAKASSPAEIQKCGLNCTPSIEL